VNRDAPVTTATVALATGKMMVAARRAAPPGPSDPAAAVTAIRAALAPLWPKVPPEAVRDVLATAAEGAAEAGITRIPESITSRYPAYGELIAAVTLLDMAGRWYRAGKPASQPGRPAPHQALASSVAFDRDEDDDTLTALAILLALAFTAVPAGES
jgi:hypothetical protein